VQSDPFALTKKINKKYIISNKEINYKRSVPGSLEHCPPILVASHHGLSLHS
jgi:hypothetical protein